VVRAKPDPSDLTTCLADMLDEAYENQSLERQTLIIRALRCDLVRGARPPAPLRPSATLPIMLRQLGEELACPPATHRPAWHCGCGQASVPLGLGEEIPPGHTESVVKVSGPRRRRGNKPHCLMAHRSA